MVCRNREILFALEEIQRTLTHQQRQLSAITAVLTKKQRADTSALQRALDGLESLVTEGKTQEEKDES